MGQYDITLKNVFETGGAVLLASLGIVTPARRLNVELPTTRERRMDFLAESDGGDLVHLELQTGREEKMPLRMLGYWVDVMDRYPVKSLPCLRQVVLYVGTDEWAPAPIERPEIRFSYETVRALDIDARNLVERGDVGDAVLAILCRDGSTHSMIRHILQRISEAPESERADAITQLVVLAGLRRARPKVETEYRKMSIVVSVEDSAILRPPIDKAFAEGEAKGEARGEARMLARVLARRFGPLPDGFEDRLNGMSSDRLHDIIDGIDDATTLAEATGEEATGKTYG